MPPSDQWRYKFRRKNAWVFVPTDNTVAYGQEVKALIEKHWNAPKYYYHLRNGGHVSALNHHKANKYYLHLDIKNFFGHINASRITRCLKNMISYAKAREVAIHSTVRNPKVPTKSMLPFGFVQSPIIASVCLSKSALGRCLHRMSMQKNIAVSVYMDDIILSSDDLAILSNSLKEIERAALRSDLPLNKRKQEGPAPKVTAFNIELSQNNLAIKLDRLSEFVSAYVASANPHEKAGIRRYVRQINATQDAKFP